MRVYCDNDVIHKLAACDLIHAALNVFDAAPSDAVVLPTAKYKFGLTKPEKARAKYGAAVFDRIRGFIGAANELTSEPDPRDVAMLAPVLKIDVGEQILFAAASRDESALLTTGDKRSLEALADALGCTSIADRLRGRVVCFEQLIRRISDVSGFAQVLEHVVPAVACDATLRIVFCRGIDATERDVLAGLDSYIGDLRSKTGSLLIR